VTNDYVRSLQQPSTTTYVSAIFAHHIASHCTSLPGNHVLFNQIWLSLDEQLPLGPSSPTTIAPVGMKVVSSPTCPSNPKHFDDAFATPFASDWREPLFQNYEKMMTSGTFSVPLLCFSVPPGKTILRPRIACRVKDTSVVHQYDLYALC
jgi:hypothetical protein